MSFESVLRRILDDCDDARGIAFMGTDGIPIEELSGTDPEQPGSDVTSVGVEFGRILSEARKASDAVGGGVVEELVLRLTGFWVLLRVVDDENFLILSVGPDANIGKARWVLRRDLVTLRAEL